jgi:putative transcriptional regulator
MARVEHGDSVQASNLIRILRALQLVENLDTLIPEPAVSPLQQLKMQGKRRQRASSKSTKSKKDESWSWGDEE